MGSKEEGVQHVRPFSTSPSPSLPSHPWVGVHTKPIRRFWQLATDALPPQDAKALAEDLGIELDTPEHATVERGPLCAGPSVLGKRRR